MPDISSTFAAYEKHLSKQRLEPFVDAANPAHERTLSRYQANVQICEALYPTLHVVEVVIRNHIASAIAHKKGTNWLTNAPERWMRGEELKKVQDAMKALAKAGKPVDAGRMIAELNFGFWTSLFDRHYEKQQLWAGSIRSMFSNMVAGTDKIAVIRARLNRVRELRNRVFHYEPIWHWADLERQHQEILETIQWVSKDMHDFVMGMDRFVTVYAAAETNRKRVSAPIE
jgi:hypothetical protein